MNQIIAEHEGELVYLALADRGFVQSVAHPDLIATFRAKINTAGVSGDPGAKLAT